MSLVTDLQQQLDETGAGVFWPAAHLYDALNEAQLALYAKSRHRQTTATLTLGSGVDLVTIPTNIMIPQEIHNGEVTYFPTTHARLEQYSRYWKQEGTGTPKFFVLWDYSKFRVYPRPDAGYSYTLVGVPWPAEITAGNTDIVEPRSFRQAVLYRAASTLIRSTLPDTAELLEKLSDEQLRKLKVETYRNSSRYRRIRPGTKFNLSQLGNIYTGKNLD